LPGSRYIYVKKNTMMAKVRVDGTMSPFVVRTEILLAEVFIRTDVLIPKK